MKIKIEYDYFGKDFRAFTAINGNVEVALSDKSFADAKEQLVEKIKNQQKIIPPESEEVEL